MNFKLVLTILVGMAIGGLIGGIAIAAPMALGDVFVLDGKALTSFPDAGAFTRGVLYDTTNNLPKFSDGTSWNAFGSITEITPTTQYLKRCFGAPTTPTATSFSATGCSTWWGTSGTGSSSNDSDGMAVLYTTTAGIGSCAGWLGAATGEIQGQSRPKIAGALKFTSTLTDYRQMWVVLSNTNICTVDSNSAAQYIGLRFTQGTDTRWQCCSSDGATAGCANGVVNSAPTINTRFDIVWDYTASATQPNVYVNGVLMCNGNFTNPPAGTVSLGLAMTSSNIGGVNTTTVKGYSMVHETK